MSHDIFISYSSINQKIVEKLSAYLEQNGIRCWIAYRDIPVGKDWADFIPQAIKDCKIMVYVHSSTSNASVEINKEIALSLKHGRPILPFKIENTDYAGSKAYHLVTINWIDAFPNPEDHFGTLLSSIRNIFLEIENGTYVEEKQKLSGHGKTTAGTPVKTENNSTKINKYWKYVLSGIIVTIFAIYGGIQYRNYAKIESDLKIYHELVHSAGSDYQTGEDSYASGLHNYEKAAAYEMEYANGKYADKFNLNAQQKKIDLAAEIDSLVYDYKKKATFFEDYEDAICIEQLIHYYKKILLLQPDNDEIIKKKERCEKLLSQLKK